MCSGFLHAYYVVWRRRWWEPMRGRLFLLRKHVAGRTDVRDKQAREIDNTSKGTAGWNKTHITGFHLATENGNTSPGQRTRSKLSGWVCSSAARSSSRPQTCTRCWPSTKRQPRLRSGGVTTKCRWRSTRTGLPKTRRPPRNSRLALVVGSQATRRTHAS